jgi:hypothetical protein
MFMPLFQNVVTSLSTPLTQEAQMQKIWSAVYQRLALIWHSLRSPIKTVTAQLKILIRVLEQKNPENVIGKKEIGAFAGMKSLHKACELLEVKHKEL